MSFVRLARIVPILVRALFLEMWVEAEGRPYAHRVFRHVLEEAGVSYVKLGQYLAMRVDVLSPALCAELERLFDRAAKLDAATIRAAVTDSLGRPLADVFESFDDVPLGSASIAQVHRARTWAGESVAVKVRRPGVVDGFREEVEILRFVARLIDAVGVVRGVRLLPLVEAFTKFTAQELDLNAEARTAVALGRHTWARVSIPRVFEELSSEGVLVYEYVEGTPLHHLCRLAESGRPEEARAFAEGGRLDLVVRALADSSLEQLFVLGLFHGDPHPGNLLLARTGTLYLIDFGIFGSLSREDREVLRTYVEQHGLGNAREAARAYGEMCLPGENTEMSLFEQEIAAILADWWRSSQDVNRPARERHMGRWQAQMLQRMREHQVQLRPDFLLVWRTLLLLDTVGLRLPVGFNLVETLRSFFARHPRPLPPFRIPAPGVSPSPGSLPASLGLLTRGDAPLNIRIHRMRGGDPLSAALALAIVVGGLAAIGHPVSLVTAVVMLAVATYGWISGPTPRR